MTALLSEPNSRPLPLDPRHECLQDSGVTDMIMATDLADLAPVVVNFTLLFAFLCGDWVETTCLVFDISIAVLLAGVVSARTFCYVDSQGSQDTSELYPKPYDLFFLIFLEALMAVLHLTSFCLILANRPGPGTSSEMIIEPLLKLWKRRTFKHIFIKLVTTINLLELEK